MALPRLSPALRRPTAMYWRRPTAMYWRRPTAAPYGHVLAAPYGHVLAAPYGHVVASGAARLPEAGGRYGFSLLQAGLRRESPTHSVSREALPRSKNLLIPEGGREGGRERREGQREKRRRSSARKPLLSFVSQPLPVAL